MARKHASNLKIDKIIEKLKNESDSNNLSTTEDQVCFNTGTTKVIINGKEEMVHIFGLTNLNSEFIVANIYQDIHLNNLVETHEEAFKIFGVPIEIFYEYALDFANFFISDFIEDSDKESTSDQRIVLKYQNIIFEELKKYSSFRDFQYFFQDELGEGDDNDEDEDEDTSIKFHDIIYNFSDFMGKNEFESFDELRKHFAHKLQQINQK